jgi:hypothetical protein
VYDQKMQTLNSEVFGCGCGDRILFAEVLRRAEPGGVKDEADDDEDDDIDEDADEDNEDEDDDSDDDDDDGDSEGYSE